MGRKAHVVTQENKDIVLQLRAKGKLLPQIAQELGIGVTTLGVYYKTELKDGKAELGVLLEDNLYECALMAKDDKGYLSALFFALKTQFNYRERTDVNLSSEDGTMSPKRPVQLLPAVNEEEDPELPELD